MLARIARFSLRHRRLVAAAWVVLFAAGIALGSGVFERLDPDVGDVAGTESARAEARLDALDPGGESIAAVADGIDPRDPAVAASLRATAERLRAIPGVAEVADPVTRRCRSWSPPTGGPCWSRSSSPPASARTASTRPWRRPRPSCGGWTPPGSLVGGGPLQDWEFEDQVESDLARAELLSMPVVLVLLLVIFGGIVAAGLPVLVALVGVAGTLLALLGISAVTEVSVYSVNVVTMLGLGLAVDYALLLVSPVPGGAGHPRPAGRGRGGGRDRRPHGRLLRPHGGRLPGRPAGLRRPVPALHGLRRRRRGPDRHAGRRHPPPRPARHVGPPASAPPDPGARPAGLFAPVSRVVQRRALLIVVAVAVPLVVAATPFLHARYQQPDAGFLPGRPSPASWSRPCEARFAPGVWVEPVVVVADAGTDEAAASTPTAGRSPALDGVRGGRGAAGPGRRRPGRGGAARGQRDRRGRRPAGRGRPRGGGAVRGRR